MLRASPVTLTRQQAELADRLADARAPIRLRLTAPTGSGKSVAAAEAAARLLAAEGSVPILYIVPPALQAQAASTLTAALGGLQPSSLTRPMVRTMLESDGDPLAGGNPAVLPASLLAQADVVAYLKSTDWRLIVVDEYHAFSRRERTGLLQLVEAAHGAHLLVITVTPADDEPLPDLTAVVWTRESAVMPPARRTLHARYRPSIAEIEIDDATRRVAATVDEISRKVLIQRLESSLPALESTVAGMLERRQSWSVESSLPALESRVVDMLERRQSRSVAERASLASLAELLGDLSDDTKLEACTRLVQQIRLDGGSVIVFAQFSDTARYVSDALADALPDVRLVTRQIVPTRREEDVATFVEHGGIVVVTDGAAGEVDLNRQDASGISFDLPNRNSRWEQRWRPIDRVLRTREAVMHVLLPDTLPSDQLEHVRSLGIHLDQG